MINTRLRMELLLKDEEMGRGAQETSKEDKVCFVLKVLDGILGGEGTLPYLEPGGVYMTVCIC